MNRKIVTHIAFSRSVDGSVQWFIFAICDDGSMWSRSLTLNGDWVRERDIPQPPKPAPEIA